MFKKFFKGIDLYQQRFNNLFLRENKFSLRSGQFISISIFLLMVPSFIYFGQDLYFKSNPKVTKSSEILTERQRFNFGSNGFYIAAYLVNRTKREGQIRDISGFYRFLGIGIKHDYNDTLRFVFTPCKFSEIDFQPTLSEHPIYKDYYGFCPPKDAFNNITVGGLENFKFFLSFSRCNRTIFNTDCKSEEEIDDFENNVYVNIVTKSYIFDPKNYYEPIKEKINVFDTTLINGFEKTYTNFYEQQEIKTNKGIVLNEYKAKAKIEKEKTEFSFTKQAFIEKEGLNTFSYSIQISDTKTIYTREYIKIADVFALLGGVFNALNMIGHILMFFYYEYHKANLMLGTFRIVKFPSNSIKLIKNSSTSYIDKSPEKKSPKYISNSNIKRKSKTLVNSIKELSLINEEKEAESPSPQKRSERRRESSYNINLVDEPKGFFTTEKEIPIENDESIKPIVNFDNILVKKKTSKKSTLIQYLAQQLKNMNQNLIDRQFFNNFVDYNEKFHIREIFYSYLCVENKKQRYKKKQKLRKELINDYKNIFDLANFPKLIYEVELLKKILLSKEERNCLEILSIPVIAVDEDYNICFKKIPKREIDLDFNFLKYYEILNLKNGCSKIERRLFQLMNKYIIQKGLNVNKSVSIEKMISKKE